MGPLWAPSGPPLDYWCITEFALSNLGENNKTQICYEMQFERCISSQQTSKRTRENAFIGIFLQRCAACGSVFARKVHFLTWWRIPSAMWPSWNPLALWVRWLWCFPSVCPNCSLSFPRCSGRIEATVVLLHSSQGPRVCVIRPFSQLILCWADNQLCQLHPKHRPFIFYHFFFSSHRLGFVYSVLCSFVEALQSCMQILHNHRKANSALPVYALIKLRGFSRILPTQSLALCHVVSPD